MEDGAAGVSKYLAREGRRPLVSGRDALPRGPTSEEFQEAAMQRGPTMEGFEVALTQRCFRGGDSLSPSFWGRAVPNFSGEGLLKVVAGCSEPAPHPDPLPQEREPTVGTPG
jgi:hypothetical protein